MDPTPYTPPSSAVVNLALDIPGVPYIDAYGPEGMSELISLAFDSTGRMLAAGYAGRVSVFDLQDGSVREQYEVAGAAAFCDPSELFVDPASFSADGRWLATLSVVPDNNGDYLFGAMVDRQNGAMRGLLPPSVPRPDMGSCAAMAVSADGGVVASMWRPFVDWSPSTLVVWDRRARRWYYLRRGSRECWDEWPFALSAAGDRIACVRPDALDVYALAPRPSRAYTKRLPVKDPGLGHTGRSRVGFSPDGARVIVAYPDPAGPAVHPRTGRPLVQRAGVTAPAETRVFDAASGQLMASFHGPGGAPKVITSDGTAVIWSSEEVCPTFVRQDLVSGAVTALVRRSDDPLPEGWTMDPHGRLVAWVVVEGDRAVLRVTAVSPAPEA